MPCEKSVKGKLRHQEQAGTDSECGLLLIPYVNNELRLPRFAIRISEFYLE